MAVFYVWTMLGCIAASVFAATPAFAQEGTGRTLYVDHCAACHGDDLTPVSNAADLKKVTDADRARFDRAVLDGRIPYMPEFRGVLTPLQIEQLWTFVRSR